jgi:CO/xanthine dehydrogenase FAD-binding subunit
LEYFVPTTLQDAVDFLQQGGKNGVEIVAGATDWFPARGERPLCQPILDITKIAELQGIERTLQGWRFGAAVTWSDILTADLPNCFAGLKAAAREVGSVQIQNVATLAGNLCNASPAADGVPPLLTLDAAVEIASLSGVRSVPLTEFVLGVRQTALQPGEMVTAVTVPVLPMHVSEGVGCFIKIGARKYLVISITMVAALVAVADGKIAEARVAVGACSTVAQRVPMLEAALRGCTAAQAEAVICPAHLEALSPISDMRGSASYRADAAFELCRRAVASALTGAAQNGGLSHG